MVNTPVVLAQFVACPRLEIHPHLRWPGIVSTCGNCGSDLDVYRIEVAQVGACAVGVTRWTPAGVGRGQVATGRSARRHSSIPSASLVAVRPWVVRRRTASWARTQ